MRILHVNNIAGVSSLLVKGLRKKGVDADLIMRRPHPFRFPHETVLESSAPEFLFRMLKLGRSYDIVHTHALSYRTFFNIDIFGLKALKEKVVAHLHGTEIRKSHKTMSTKAALQLCDLVVVGTPDLLSYCPEAIWLPTPIDPALKPSQNHGRHGKALYFKKWYEPEKEETVRMRSEEMGMELTIREKPISHSKMPDFLSQFEVYFDRFTIPSLSKTALEALACGCKVIGWNGPVTNSNEILRIHNIQSVTEKLIKLYEGLLHEITCARV